MPHKDHNGNGGFIGDIGSLLDYTKRREVKTEMDRRAKDCGYLKIHHGIQGFRGRRKKYNGTKFKKHSHFSYYKVYSLFIIKFDYLFFAKI